MSALVDRMTDRRRHPSAMPMSARIFAHLRLQRLRRGRSAFLVDIETIGSTPIEMTSALPEFPQRLSGTTL